MRGVLYRTDEDGNPLETPELKVSAINGSNIKVYANQEAKNAALENGDIKPGDVVLSGGTGRDAPIELDWENAIYSYGSVTGHITKSSNASTGSLPPEGFYKIIYTATKSGMLNISMQVNMLETTNRSIIYLRIFTKDNKAITICRARNLIQTVVDNNKNITTYASATTYVQPGDRIAFQTTTSNFESANTLTDVNNTYSTTFVPFKEI